MALSSWHSNLIAKSRYTYIAAGLGLAWGVATGCATQGTAVGTPQAPGEALLPDSALARFQRAMHLGKDLLLSVNNGTTVSNQPAWEAMARLGPAVLPLCTGDAHPSSAFSPAEAQAVCAQLLTAYIATNRTAQVDQLVGTLSSRLHLAAPPAVQQWYDQQLTAWFGNAKAALKIVNAILERSSEAVTMHHALLLSTAKLLEPSADDVRVQATLPKPTLFPSEPAADNPFPLSKEITGIEFNGTYANYTRADTWYSSWGADDVLYTIVSDGQMDDSAGNVLDVQSYAGEHANTGRALITGNDPLRLTVTPLPLVEASAEPYGGRYPSATLMYRGVWYVSTYTLDDLPGTCGNWCKLGPLVGFHYSTDKGRTWHEPPATVTPAHPLFGETAKDSARVKLSAAHFVDFGKELQYSPDGKAYLIGHGATAAHSNSTWISGDQFYMARVTPSLEAMNDVKAWEFYAGQDAQGKPRWSHDFADIKPLLDWPDHLGNVSVTYDAPLKKFLMFTSRGWPTVGPFDTMVLEADQLTGPWRLVSYLKHFGPQIYYPNVPSKFISKDGCTMWLMYSANFGMGQHEANPFGSGYWMTLHKIRLLAPNLCRER